MDAGEYWLLDSVVRSWDSLAMLVSKDIETAFNKRSHGLTRDQLINVLEHLFLRGDLLAQRMEKSVRKEFFIPTRTEIEEAFSGRVRCFYGLTLQGGARWEEVSQPDPIHHAREWSTTRSLQDRKNGRWGLNMAQSFSLA